MKNILALTLLFFPMMAHGQPQGNTSNPLIGEVVITPEFTYGPNSLYIKANDDGSFQYNILDQDKNKSYLSGKITTLEPLTKTGKYTFFTPDGIPYASGFYSNNIPYMGWSYFDQDGEVITTLDYSKAIQFLKVHGNMDIGDDYVYAAKKSPKFGKKGMKDFLRFLQENAVYPPFPLVNNEEGRVVCQFVIDKTGQLINARIVEGVYEDFDMEVIRILSLSPPWKPGKEKGEAVNVMYTLAINFKLF